MCGIAGIVDFNFNSIDESKIKIMLSALHYRGPDQEGVFLDGHAGLGIRRLKIIALDNGAQPCFSNNNRFVLVFNGEIYNYRLLRHQLIKQGYSFTTDSDAEVIVNLFQRDRENFYHSLDGMFAVAIYDRKENSLFLARDYSGKKPLYYFYDSGVTVFASELNSLLKYGQIPKEINIEALDYFLKFRVTPGDQSILRSVNKVNPGGGVFFNQQDCFPKQYWRVHYQPLTPASNLNQWLNDLDKCLNESIEKRLTAEVPVGTMLSGGLDSSLITAMAQKQSSKPLNTFSIGFHEAKFNEADHARRLAKDLGTCHHEFFIDADQAIETAHQLVAHFGEPFAFPSSIASYLMYQLAKQEVTVVLGGDGADELFGGYARYQLVSQFPHLPLDAKLPRRVDLQSKPWANYGFNEFYQDLLTDGLGRNLREKLYRPDIKASLLTQAISQSNKFSSTTGTKERSTLTQAMEHDFNHWMLEAQLVKIDIASMANSVEVRAPFLDKHVIELATRLPESYKIHNGQEKFILYELAGRYLPPYVKTRKKQELAVPLEKWVFSSFKSLIINTIIGEQALERPYFNPDALRLYVNQATEEDSYALWTLYTLEKWHQQFIDT